MPTASDTDLLVTELVLMERGYDDVPKRVERAMRDVDAANRRGVDATKRRMAEISGPDAYSGFARLSQEAQRMYERVDAAAVKSARAAGMRGRSGGAGSTRVNGRTVATVGHLNWLQAEPAPPGRDLSPFESEIQRLMASPASLRNAPGDLLKLGRTIAPRIDWSSAKKGASQFADDLKGDVEHALSALNPLKALGVGVGAMAAAGAATGFQLMRGSAEFDSLRQSLLAVEGSQKAADKSLDDLKVLARAPGLGFEQALRSYTGLRNGGMDQAFSERLIKEIANANARGGGNEETFGRIMEQIRQAGGKQYLEEQDLRPIADAGVPINALLKKRYGTGDTEELKKQGVTADRAIHDLVEDLARMPRVAGGFQNSLDNLADSIKFAEVGAGDALNRTFLPMADEFANAVQGLSEGGVVEAAFETVAGNIRAMFDIDQNGMESVVKQLLVATMDLSAAARNLANSGDGFSSLADGADSFIGDVLTGGMYSGWKESANEADRKNPEFDTSLAGEHRRNEEQVERNSQTAKERDEMHRAGFKGTLTSWERLPAETRRKMIDDADRQKKADAGKPSGAGDRATPTAASTPEERTARAVEKLVEYKRKQMDIQSASAGGGELARLGVAATEISGRSTTSKERIARDVANMLMNLTGLYVSDRQVGDGRHQSRTY